MKKLLLCLSLGLIFPAVGLAGDSEPENQGGKPAILLTQDPVEGDFDFPIVTDSNYPFLKERDAFPEPANEK